MACSQPPKGRSRWSCSPTSWLNSTSSGASPIGPCNGRSKKRTQAPSENVLGDSAQGKRRIRSLHGESPAVANGACEISWIHTVETTHIRRRRLVSGLPEFELV